MLSKEGAKFLLKAILKPILIKILVFEYKHYELSAFMQKMSTILRLVEDYSKCAKDKYVDN